MLGNKKPEENKTSMPEPVEPREPSLIIPGYTPTLPKLVKNESSSKEDRFSMIEDNYPSEESPVKKEEEVKNEPKKAPLKDERKTVKFR